MQMKYSLIKLLSRDSICIAAVALMHAIYQEISKLHRVINNNESLNCINNKWFQKVEKGDI